MILLRVPAGAPAPALHWWGRAYVRVWRNREQLVVVLRLPWWAEYVDVNRDDVRRCQLVVSWRRHEGWRHGWRSA